MDLADEVWRSAFDLGAKVRMVNLLSPLFIRLNKILPGA
jgi:hypothetical protein